MEGTRAGLATLRARLLGGLRLRLGEAPVAALGSRAESLLAYLLLHRDAAQPRQRLAFLLWPDSPESQARTNLRHVLHNLRRALPDLDRLVEVTPKALQWRAGAPLWLDVAAFEEAMARADRDADQDGEPAALREAAELYTGDLLEGHDDEWLLEERERLRLRYLAALERLVALLEARGDHAQAISYAERLLRLDPLREETYRALMRLHDARGDRARALRAYHACAAALERELGVEPAPATRQAYEALLPLEPEATPGGGRPGPLAAALASPPLVGRAAERARLSALWQRAERGHAQLVLVSGEPGIGKSRLVEELRAWCAHRGALTAQARSYPAEGDLAYAPVVAWLRSAALRPGLKRLDRARLGELARLLPELAELALPGPEPESPSLPESDPRRRLFDALAAAILAGDRPLLLVADDLQWCDRETLQFLHYLLRVAPEARLLVAATARREEVDLQHPLSDLVAGLRALDRLEELALERLTLKETAALAERLSGRPLAAPDAGQLHAETEGNPLFVVEALRAGWPESQAALAGISPKVQAVIEARLARLSRPALELAGLAAAIGREFTAELLAEAGEVEAEALVGALDELWRRRIVREHGADAYDFGHDKLREVAYLALGPARRRHHHLRIARALERLHAHDPGPVSAQLAAHYDRAGMAREAIAWYAPAAGEAQRVHASLEAIRLLDRGRDLLRALPAGVARDQRELALDVALLVPLGAVEGFGSSRLHQLQRRALDLARQLGVEPAPPLLRSVSIASLSQGRFEEAQPVAERLLERGERDGDGVLAVEGHYLLGIVAFWRGEPERARRHFEAAVARYRPEHRSTHLVRYGMDPKVVCLSRLGNARWFLGFARAARQARDAALALAEEIGHWPTHGTALNFAALLAVELRDQEGVRRYAAALGAPRDGEGRVVEVTREIWAGYLAAAAGGAAGFAWMERALADPVQAAPVPGFRAIVLRLLLEACARTGDAHRGLRATEAALQAAGSARLWEAETHRFRAEFLAATGAPGEAVEAALRRAVEVARRQGAGSLELRAAASLVRHQLERGDRTAVAEARRLLAAAVGRLPDGADVPELAEAAALPARRG